MTPFYRKETLQKIYYTPISSSLLKVKRFLLLPLVLIVNLAVAQHIDGPTFCTVGQTYTYDFVDTYLPDSYSWQVTGGTKTYTSKSYTNIQWTTPGINVIKYINSDGEFELTVDVVSPGGYAETPVDAGVITPCKSFIHTANMIPANYYSDDYGDTGDDIFYKFTLNEQQEVEISHCGSALPGTFLYLLNNSFQEIEFNDGNGPLCSGKASIRKTLAAGVYYVVAEGAYGDNGSITTQISVPARAGSTKENAINAGTISLGGVPYSNTQSNISSNYFCQNYGQPSDDIYYKFTLSEANNIQLSHCASSIATYLHLLDSNGNLLQSNGGNGPVCTTSRASLSSYLQPGTYYVVSEGYGSNAGSITTQIQVIAQPPTVSIVSNAGGNIVCKNSSVTFTATVTNAGASPSYQWKLNGNNVGGNSATFTSSGPFNTDDEVSVVVTSSLPGSLTASSNIIFLDAYEAKAGTLSSSGGTIFCAGENVSTTIHVSGYDGIPHFWVSNNGGITWNIYDNITPGSTFTLNLTTPGKWVIRTQAYNTMCGWSEVKELALDVLTKPALTITAEQGKGVKLSTILKVTDQNQVPLSCSWTRSPDLNLDEEFEASHGANTTVIVNPVVPTTYTATFWNGACYSQASITVAPNNYNYVVSNTILEDGNKTIESLEQLGADKREQNVTYLDGLGREVQTIITQGSPLGKDLVQPFAYDVYGRKEKSYLPYAANDGNGFFKSNALVKDNSYTKSDQYTFYQATKAIAGKHSTDSAPYAQAVFDASPLNQVEKHGAPGMAWQPDDAAASVSTDHSIKTVLRTNVADEVRIWNHVSGANNFETKGYYEPNTLLVTETRDEANAITVEYKDLEGRLLLKKVQESGDGNSTTSEDNFLLTSYIYDDFGNLTLVIQPEGYRHLPSLVNTDGHISFNTLSAFASTWCFAYSYDAKRRLVEKHVPGSGWTRFVYDNRDRLIFTQDARQHGEAVWGYSIYDDSNRPIEAGIYRPAIALDRQALQAELDTWSQVHGVAPYELASVQKEPLIHTYYDHYDHSPLTGKAFKTEIGVTDDISKGRTYVNMERSVIGQVTGKQVKVLNTNTWLITVNYYNDKHELIQTVGDNYLGGTDRTTTRYDFAGRIRETLFTQSKGTSHGGNVYVVHNSFVYDDSGRLLETRQRTGSDPGTIMAQPEVLLAKNSYNELGQLVDKGLHSTDQGKTFLQSVDYRYNIRGWLSSINNGTISNDGGEKNDDSRHQVRPDLFGLELSYNQGQELNLTQTQYNGNIAEMRWKSIGDGVQRGYGYQYDKASRLTKALYRAKVNGSWTGEMDHFSVEIPAVTDENGKVQQGYDGNGNIRGLVRHGLLRGSAHNRTSFDQSDFGLVDQLAYNYVGNRLAVVNDEVTPNNPAINSAGDFRDNTAEKTYSENDPLSWEYSYDANGNMTGDANKGITVTYNHLNLVERVDMAGKGYLTFAYTADGRKLQKQVFEDTGGTAGPELKATTDYAGLFLYQQDTVFAHTSEGRVLLDGGQWRYEYHIKDHLGNLRVTFGEPETTRYMATMEEGRRTEENLFFSGFGEPDVRVGVAKAYDHTHKTAYPADDLAKVVRLNAARGSLASPKLQLRVLPGDTVLLKVHSKYVNLKQSSLDASVIAGALLGTATGYYAVLDGSTGATLIQNGAGTTLATLGSSQTTGIPDAGLSYFLLDEKGDTIQGAMGYVAINSSAAVWDLASLTAPHQELALAVTNITKPGFIHIEVGMKAGAAAENIDLYFDDLEVEHRQGILLQENHYDPWGLNLAGIERQATPDHLFHYNGKERQTELGLNWIDYGFRNYDPQIGRWHSPDPVSHWAESLTPYRYGLNNPARYIDLLGLWEGTNGGYKTDKKDEIERFMTYLDVERNALGNSPSIDQANSFVEGEMEGGLGRLSDGTKLVSEIGITGYTRGNGEIDYIADGKSAFKAWNEIDKDWNARNENGGLDAANKVVNYVGMNNDVKEGLFKLAGYAENGGYMKYLSTIGKITGGTSVGISFYKFSQNRTAGNAFNLAVDAGLLFAGPLGGIIGGVAEATGVKDAVANEIDYRFFINEYHNNSMRQK